MGLVISPKYMDMSPELRNCHVESLLLQSAILPRYSVNLSGAQADTCTRAERALPLKAAGRAATAFLELSSEVMASAFAIASCLDGRNSQRFCSGQ